MIKTTHLVGAVLASLALTFGSGAAHADSWPFMPYAQTSAYGVQELDAQSQQEVIGHVFEIIERSAARSGRGYYANFRIAGGSAPSQGGGFAPRLEPRGGVVVPSGTMEIVLYDKWSVSIFPMRNGNWQGEVSARVYSYRIIDPNGRAFPEVMPPLHWFRWKARVEGGRLWLDLDSDGRNDTQDPVQRLIARVNNVNASQVEVWPANLR